MGTNYVVHSDDNHEISVDEHSNRFTLMLSANKDNFGDECLDNAMIATGRDGDIKAFFIDSLHYLNPEQLADMAIEMLQVSLYWHKDNKKAHAEIINRVSKLVA